MSFHEIFEEILDRLDRVAHFDVNVRIERFANKRIVRNDETVVGSSSVRHVIFVSVVSAAIFRITVVRDISGFLKRKGNLKKFNLKSNLHILETPLEILSCKDPFPCTDSSDCDHGISAGR